MKINFGHLNFLRSWMKFLEYFLTFENITMGCVRGNLGDYFCAGSDTPATLPDPGLEQLVPFSISVTVLFRSKGQSKRVGQLCYVVEKT